MIPVDFFVERSFKGSVISELAEVLEIYSYILHLHEITLDLVSVLLGSVSNILTVFIDGSENQELHTSLSLFIESLFLVECTHGHHYEKEIIVTRIVVLFERIMSHSLWQSIGETNLWRIIYSLYYISTNVCYYCMI